jgi:replicative DNA helicase
MTALAEPHNHDAERAVLGSVLLTGSRLDVLTVDLELRAEHFHEPQHQAVYAAMVALHDNTQPVDSLTVCEHLDAAGQLERAGGQVTVESLMAYVPASGNLREYGRIVIDHATWRQRLHATVEMQAAIVDRDQVAFDTAEAKIATSDRPADSTSTPEALASDAWDWLEATGSDAIAMPFRNLNEMLAGGLRRGDVTLVAGWSSMGKSCLADQILEHAAEQYSAHLYINEMSRQDRYNRRLARHSGVQFAKIMKRTDLTPEELKRLLRTMGTAPSVGITDCAGWSGKDIARHVRRHRFDIVVVDLLNLIPHDGPERGRTQQVDAISATLNAAARQANCHLILVCQLNQERNKGALLPRPVRRDIRESGQLANDAANVIFVHREQVEKQVGPDQFMTELLPDGSVWLDKARNGQLGGVKVMLDPGRMSFTEIAQLRAVA